MTLHNDKESSGHVKAAIIGGIFALLAAIIGGIFLILNTMLSNGIIVLNTSKPNIQPTQTIPNVPEATATIQITTPIVQEPSQTTWSKVELIYAENFEGGAPIGWEASGMEVIQLADGNHVWHTVDGNATFTLPTNSQNYAFELKTMQASGNGGLGIMGIRVEEGFPCEPMYLSYIDTSLDWLSLVEKQSNCDEIRNENGGKREGGLFGAYKVVLQNGIWYTRSLEAKDTEVRLYLDGLLVRQDQDDTLKSNRITIGGCCEDSSHDFYFDDILVWLIE